MTSFSGLHVHLLGIGGAGVSALVPLLMAEGARVSGCDGAPSATLDRLRAAGITAHQGHDPAHLAGVDVVVYSSAVPVEHPELQAAAQRGLPVMTRGAALVALLERRRTIAVAGSHGKTSTTWMLGHLLASAGIDPLVMVGGTVGSLGGGARPGGSPWAVAEVDESDGSFARVAARVAIVTNLDAEHLRHYGSMAGLEAAFNGWLRTVPADGLVIVPAHGLSERVTAGLSAPILSVGLERGDVQVVGLEPGADGSRARLVQHGHDLGPITVAIPGVHMVLNAAMASVAARFAAPGVDLGALATCERVRRRFTVHGHVGGVRVVEDYGHHPTEVRATIAAARLGGGQVRVVFQPHRHTRTADCFAAFTGAFDQAHRVAFLPIYGAGEDPIPGVTSEALAESIIRRREADPDPGVLATCDRGAALAHALSGAQPGDTLLLLGAGDVGHLAQDALHASVHR